MIVEPHLLPLQSASVPTDFTLFSVKRLNFQIPCPNSSEDRELASKVVILWRISCVASYLQDFEYFSFPEKLSSVIYKLE